MSLSDISDNMGVGSKITSIVFRASALVSAAIIAGILGQFLSIINDVNVSANGKIVYAMVIASLALVISIVLIVPCWFTFRAFSLDFIMFLCWMIAFGLLANVSGQPPLIMQSRWLMTCRKSLRQRMRARVLGITTIGDTTGVVITGHLSSPQPVSLQMRVVQIGDVSLLSVS